MALYTQTIADILDTICWEKDREDIVTIDEQIEFARPFLFDFNYKLYDPLLKEEFEKEFINHFLMREIGSETTALFKRRIKSYLDLAYPKYKRLYDSMTDSINPFVNYDLYTDRDVDEERTDINSLDRTDGITNDRTEHMDIDTNVQSGSNTNDFNRNLFQETPDERLTITAEDGKGLIEYATTITEDKSTGAVNSHSDTDSNRVTTNEEIRNMNREDLENKKRDFTHVLNEHKRGKIGNATYSQMLNEYLNTFDSINSLMFKDMKKYFMALLN